MSVFEPIKTLIVEGVNLINTGSLAQLLGLLVLLLIVASQIRSRVAWVRRWSTRAAVAGFALYVVLMIATFGESDAGFLLGVLWRGLLAGALTLGVSAIALGVVAVLAGGLLRGMWRRLSAATTAIADHHEARRQRRQARVDAAAAAKRERELAPARRHAELAEATAAEHRNELNRHRDRIRYDLTLQFRQVRKLDRELLTTDEFNAQLDHALAPDDAAEIDRRVAALREVFSVVLAKAPKLHTIESFAKQYMAQHASIDQSAFDEMTKAKLHRWVNVHSEQEVGQLRIRTSR